MTAPGLDQLHDVWQPPPVSWMPQTATWYVVFAVAAVLAVWFAYRGWRGWVRNRYRREALKELASCRPGELNLLLKRCALAAWPREQVASLSGGEWLEFLDRSYSGRGFTSGPGRVLADLSYRPAPASDADVQLLRDLVQQWIKRHHVRT